MDREWVVVRGCWRGSVTGARDDGAAAASSSSQHSRRTMDAGDASDAEGLKAWKNCKDEIAAMRRLI